jgi:O-antigen ligase
MRESEAVSARPLAETAAVVVLGIAAVAAPLALGAATNWGRLALEAAMVTVATLWAVSARRPALLVLMPMGVALAGMLQLVPLPDDVLVRIAPVSAGGWKMALAGHTRACGCISIDPLVTAASIRRLFLGLAIVSVVTDLCRFRPHRRHLTLALTASAVVVLVTGLVFGRATTDRVMMGFVKLAGPIFPHNDPTLMPTETVGAGTTEWVAMLDARYPIDTGNVGDAYGCYIYSNHFAGGVVCTLPVAIAAWLCAARGLLPAIVVWGLATAAFGGVLWLVGPVVQSRAGFAALLVAGFALASLALPRGWLRFAMAACLAAGVTAIVVALVLLMGPLEQLAPLVPEEWASRLGDMLHNARTLAAQVGLRMFVAAPLFGTGLGTFAEIFPRYSTDACMLFFAHNDYVQLLAESGLAGAAVAIALAAVLARRCLIFCRTAPTPYRIAAAGPWAACAGAAVHAAFDWNVHLPANGFLTCLVCGLAASSVPAAGVSWMGSSRAVQGVLVGAAWLCLAILVRDAFSEAVRQDLRDALAADRSATRERVSKPSADRLVAAIEKGADWAAWDRGDSHLRLLMGQAILHVASRSDDIDRREELKIGSLVWFDQARRLSAGCRGLPEATAPPPLQR